MMQSQMDTQINSNSTGLRDSVILVDYPEALNQNQSNESSLTQPANHANGNNEPFKI